MAYQLPLDQTFILSIWLEAVLYGFLLALFLASCYANVTLRRAQDAHSKIMFAVGSLMFAIATAHVGINCYRLIEGYVIHGRDPGGPAAYFGVLSSWDHIFKDTLYATQEILGDAVAIYRTYVVWGRNWKIVTPLAMLFIAGTVSGYSVCALYPTETSDASIFDPRLLAWISAFYAVSFVQSALTTGLMAWRIWRTDRRTARFRAERSALLPLLRILVESAALQLLVELVVLAFYAAGLNAQYILLETITPTVAITFNAITIRIALRSSEVLARSKSSAQLSDGGGAPAHTFGSIPMRPINVSIKRDVEAHGDGRSESDVALDQK